MSCKIERTADPRTLEIINKMLARTWPDYREVQGLSGFSRMTLWRHRHQCLSRELLRSFRDKRVSMARRRHVTIMDGRIILGRDPVHDPHGWSTPREISRSQILPGDVIVVLRYYQVPVRNPGALRFDDHGHSQRAFLEHCAPSLQRKFIEQCHRRALEENRSGTYEESPIAGPYCPWPPVIQDHKLLPEGSAADTERTDSERL